MGPDGNVYVAGYTTGALDGNVNAGSNDIFVMKFDASGTHQWTVQRGTSAAEVAYAVEARVVEHPRFRGCRRGLFRLVDAVLKAVLRAAGTSDA